jgi:predicted metallo-beta-lactamase superfamily hydrolase
MTTQTFLTNLETTQKELFSNQQVLLNSFNNFLNDNQEFKSEFFKMNKEEQDNCFKYVVNQVIGKIAIEKTFN